MNDNNSEIWTLVKQEDTEGLNVSTYVNSDWLPTKLTQNYAELDGEEGGELPAGYTEKVLNEWEDRFPGIRFSILPDTWQHTSRCDRSGVDVWEAEIKPIIDNPYQVCCELFERMLKVCKPNELLQAVAEPESLEGAAIETGETIAQILRYVDRETMLKAMLYHTIGLEAQAIANRQHTEDLLEGLLISKVGPGLIDPPELVTRTIKLLKKSGVNAQWWHSGGHIYCIRIEVAGIAEILWGCSDATWAWQCNDLQGDLVELPEVLAKTGIPMDQFSPTILKNKILGSVNLVRNAHIKFEYDCEYRGGDYSDVGSFVLVPRKVVDKYGYEKGFKYHTGIDVIHIINYQPETYYTITDIETEVDEDGNVLPVIEE